MKRALSLILALVFVICICASAPITITANAKTQTYRDGLFEYFIEDGRAVIYSCDDSASGTVTVPGNIKGYPVTLGTAGLSYLVFYQNNKIKKIIVSEGVDCIGENAITECANLTEIVLPQSLTVVNNYAFMDCTKLNKVNIPYNIKEIYPSAFYGTAIYKNSANWVDGCFYYDNCLLSVPESMSGTYSVREGTRVLGSWSLEWTTNLTKLVLPDSMVTICDYITTYGYNFSTVSEINIPKNVSYIGDNFLDAATPIKYTVHPENQYFTMYKGFLCNKELTKIIRYTWEVFEGLDEVRILQIPEGVKEIAAGAFCGLDNVSEIIIPSTVKKIGGRAFSHTINCQFVSLVIPENVEDIGLCAFEGSDFKSIEINGNVKELKVGTFRGMENLVSIKLPDTLEVIGIQCFYGCSKLEVLDIPDNVVKIAGFGVFERTPIYNNAANWDNGVFYVDNYLIDADTDISGNYKIKDGTKCIADAAFSYCKSLTGVEIPNNVTHIGEDAFLECPSLKSVTLPSSVQVIGEDAFGYYFDTTYYDYRIVPDFSIKSVSNSAAEKYAKTNSIKFIATDTPVVTTKNSGNGIQVSWNAVENAQGYVLYKRVYDASTKKWGKWQVINNNVTDVTYLDTDVTLGTSYRYTARAKVGDAVSGYTSSATIKYNVTPTVKVANASNGIKVSWSTAANATGYTVYRSTYSNGKWSGWKNMGTAKANKTAWVDKNVKTGVAYKYTVRAAYGKILSSYNKNGASVVFLNTPTVKIANNATGMKVAWSKVAGATGYVIYSSQYDPATNSWSKWSNRGAVNTNSWIDTAVQSGVTYKYTVRALNGKSLSAYISSGALMYLAQPTVKIANAQAGINVSWSQSAGALGYTVYRSEYDAKTKKWSSWKNRGTATADKSSWVDKKVTSGKYYKYTVRAINGNAKSTFVSTGGMIFLAQPTVTVSKDTNSNVISWNEVNGATGYRVFRKANGETNWSIVATVKNTSCFDTNVNDESTYTYTVRAYKGKVWSSYDINGVTINRNYKQTVFDLVNVERAKAGLAPLEYYYNGQLAGDIRANEIAKKFAHERPDGNSCFTVFKEIGVSYGYAGENIARGQRTPEIVVNDWMNSPGHRGNILDPNYTYLIVGYDAKTNSWVQLFFSPYIDNIPDEIE